MEENENSKNTNNNKPQVTEKLTKVLNIILKTISSLIYAVLAIIAIILIYNIIQVSVLNKPYMDILGYSLFKVKTGSMSGTIEVGDIIVVKITKDVEKNDIITYEKENILVTHRIIEKQEETIITKGDANNTEDDPITNDNVIGKVVYTFENVEIWKQVFKTPEVYILVTITLILFVITSSIKEKKKE
jgi:signal peptidase